MKTIAFALTALSIFGIAACSSDVEQPEDPPVAEQDEALRIGGGGLSSWCQCKLDCDNTYSGNWRLIQLCKAQCDKTDSKCTNFSGTAVAR